MKKRENMSVVRLVAVILAVALMLPVGANAAVVETVQPCASYYLDSYNAYVYPAGNGQIQVWFTVTGTGYMETLGALTIKIYESKDNCTWTWVKSYSNGNYPEMLGYNDYFYSSHVDYQGVAGMYYKAYVCIWAGEDGGGDTRYFYTSSKLAT